MEKSYASPSSGDLAGLARSYSNRPVKVIPLQHPETTSNLGFSLTTSSSSMFARWRSKMKAMSITEWISIFLPCYRWVRSYNFHDNLQSDLMAGITVGVMVVPQVIVSSLISHSSTIFLYFFFRIFFKILII